MPETFYDKEHKEEFNPEAGFEPSIDQGTTQKLVNYYKQFPDQFNEEKLNQVALHAQHYKIPFAASDSDNDVSIKKLVSQAASGFAEGFTTLKTGDDPANEWEGIARNIGHLAGFVGWVPIPNAVGKMSRLAAAAKAIKGRSLPMIGANWLTKKASKIAVGAKAEATLLRGNATKDAMSNISKISPIVDDVVSGAFHLGTASAISAWQGGIDEMMTAFVHGAETGAVFRGIGNFIKTGNPQGDKLLRTMSASVYSGLPSTMAGATTPEQVYQYLLGAYFGYKEMPYTTRNAQKFVAARFKDGSIGEPVEGHKEFAKLDVESQKAAVKLADKVRGQVDELGRPITANIIMNQLLEDLPGMSRKEREGLANNILEKGVTIDKFGEIIKKVELPNSRDEIVQKGRQDDSDVGSAQGVHLKIDNFVTRNMESTWSGNETPNRERVKTIIEVDKKWKEILGKSQKGKDDTPEMTMINHLQKKYGIAPKDESDRWWRQYAIRALNEKPVSMLTAKAYTKKGKQYWDVLPQGGGNAAGNRKLLKEEPKELDKVYQQAYRRKHGSESKAPAYTVLDHFTGITNNKMRELSLLEMEEFYYRNDLQKSVSAARQMGLNYQQGVDMARSNAREMTNKFHASNFYTLDKKHDMYYYGGKGDAERMYFTQYHPDTPRVTHDAGIKQIRDAWAMAQYKQQGNRKRKSIQSFKNQFTKELNIERDDYINTYSKHMRPGMKSDRTASSMFNRAYLSNALYELELNGFNSDLSSSNIQKLYGKGMINSSKAFNKRSQVWFTTGFSGSNKRIQNDIKDLGFDNTLRYKLFNEKDTKRFTKDTPASEMVQGTDGAIYGRSDVIDSQNKGWGMPQEGGAHKSFIVSKNPTHGALLGKYAVFSATPEMEAYMQKNKLHFMIPKSAAKQYGTRKFGNIVRKGGEISVEGGETYEMYPNEMKGILSERFDSHSMEWQRLPKQMLTNLTQYSYKDINPDTIEDMYNDLSRKSFHGDAEINAQLKLLRKNPSNEAYETAVLNNLEAVGVAELLEAMKVPGMEKFATKVYRKIQRMDLASDAEKALNEGEITKEEYDALKGDKQELNVVHEKIQDLVGDSLAGLMHKYVTPYRQTVMRNFVINQIVRPVVKNSFSARMRPYEIGLRYQRTKGQNTSLLEKRDDIFYLDNGYKDMRVFSEAWDGYRRLEDVWTDYQKGRFTGKVKKQVEDTLSAIVQRTPMDSLSGAHKLQFKGFTGVRGFGTLLHPRAMEALGGADLDGDKAFGFFGGLSKDGTSGAGFKKSWMDMYHSQKEEFYKADGTVSNNKTEIDPLTGTAYRDILAFTDAETLDKINSSVLKLSPHRRMKASFGAAGGRKQLGPAVVNKSVLSSAYAAIRASDKKEFSYLKTFSGKFKGRYRVVITPKTDKESMESFRGMTRASIALGSDPMDEAGLRGREVFFKEAAKRAFNFEVKFIGKKGGTHKRLTEQMNKSEFMMRQGIIRSLSRINSVLFGNNTAEGRRWLPEEITAEIEFANETLTGMPKNSLLPKLSETLRGVDMSDNIFRRIKFDEFQKLYESHEKLADEMRPLRESIGRSSMKTPMNAYLDIVFKNKLFTQEGFDAQLDPNNKSYKAKLFSGKAFNGHTKAKRRKLDPENNMDHRAEIMRDIMVKGERFITDDISDFVSLKLIKKYTEGLSPDQIKKVWSWVDQVKKESYLYARQRKTPMNPILSGLSEAEANYIKEMEIQIAPERLSSAQDQVKTDLKIKIHKAALSPEEANLYDALMLGTFSRGNRHQVQKMKEAYKGNKWSQAFKDQISSMEEMSANTSLSKLGIISESVKDGMKKEFFKNYQEIFDKSIDVVSESEKTRIKSEVSTAEVPIEIFDPKTGERTKGNPLEASDYDAKTQKYLDEVAPFEGLYEGKLDKEGRQLYTSLKEKLDIAFPNIVGRDLNGLIRERFGKDINKIDLSDLKALDLWLNDTLNGTWYQKMFTKIKRGLPELTKWHYNMFPEAVNKDLMRKDILLLERRGSFKDVHGNVISGRIMKPTGVLEVLQDYIHKGQEWSIASSEKEKKAIREELSQYLNLDRGYDLHEIAVAFRENNVPKHWKEKYETVDNGMYLWMKEPYEKAAREIPKKHDWENLKNKSFLVKKPNAEVVNMTGQQIVDSINKVYNNKNAEAHQWLVGKPEALAEYKNLRVNKKTGEELNDFDYYKAIKKRFLSHITDTVNKGERFNMDLGIDGLRWVARRVMISQIPSQFSKERSEIMKNLPRDNEATGQYDFDIYFPHLNFNKKSAAKQMEIGVDYILNNKNMSKEEKDVEIRKIMIHHSQMTGDYMATDTFGAHFDQVQGIVSDLVSKRALTKDKITWFQNKKMGNQFSRKAHIDGWSRDPESYETYIKNIHDTYYRLASQIITKDAIVDWSYKSWLKAGGDSKKKTTPNKKDLDLINSWRTFFNLYTQGAMGYPTKIPEAVMKNPNMKLKGSFYAFTADSEVTKKMNRIANKLGIPKSKMQETFPEMGGPYDMSTIARISNMEAKYALASLLAHPKSSVANLYGGSVHTLISTGYDNFKKARDIEYLMAHVNPKWKKMSDVEEFVKSHGIIEEFLLYEASINPEVRGKKWGKFMKDAAARLRKDPSMKDETLSSLAQSHGISEAIFNKAGWFMREPERILRRDAFMAHYIQAKEKFGGAIKQFDHPILIEMAKKGVKATQFLYSAPYRPMFSSTSLGKMLTRFQLWSWNAVRFRKDVINEAHYRGWQEGTPEFERFQRLATADLLMLGLSNVFMYSLFESALPAPWNYLQDTADWLLGDEKERDRAFFGAWPTEVAPLQLITPPSLRLLPGLFKGMVTDDYSKLADYTMWTMLPFGRIMRDVAGSGGMLENPMRSVEKMTGLPYMQFARQWTKYKDEEMLTPEGILGSLGGLKE